MKKKIAALLCGTMLAVSSIGFASISSDKIALGKLTPGMSTADLIEICGQPISRRGDDWYYSNFVVEIDDDRPDVVEKITTRSSDIATPTGIRVGQSADVLNALGRADDVDYEHGQTEYEYFSTDHMTKIEFKVINGTITKISCKIID